MHPSVDDLEAAPAARVFVGLVAGAHDPLAVAASPALATRLAARTRLLLDPWSYDLAQVVGESRGVIGRHRILVQDILDYPNTTWWWDPLDRREQVWLSSSADATLALAPRRSDVRWEAYAQRPRNWLVTSTSVGPGRCALDEILEMNLGDWDPPRPPERRELLIDEAAGVFEIRSASDWCRLVDRYPTPPAVEAPLGPCVSVDWTAAGEDWDGVHLSFGGMLLSHLVSTEVSGGESYLWSWDCEQTLWLRPCWTAR